MSDQENKTPESTTLPEGDFSFDLSKISLDEMLDVLDFDLDSRDFRQIARIVKALKKCLVKGSRELTGADLKDVLQGFMAYLFGGDETAKN